MTLSALAAAFYSIWLVTPGHGGHVAAYSLVVLTNAFSVLLALAYWHAILHGRLPASSPAPMPLARCAILIPTYDEPYEVLAPTIEAALRQVGVIATVLVLDDGGRSWVRRLTGALGAEYLSRESRRGAKAGNLNHGMSYVHEEFVAVLDADQVASPGFLRSVLPSLILDPRCAFVQTPQRYRNASDVALARAAKEQQAIFYGPILEGKNRLGAVVCCGTNVVYRASAIRSIGGFPEDSIAEDFLTSIRLYAVGWHARYLAGPLVSGLGPVDLQGYMDQQWRWARGCIAALFSRDLWAPSALNARQRLQFATSAAYYLSGWIFFIYWLIPVAFLTLGIEPLAENAAGQFAAIFLPYFCLSLLAVAVSARGRYGPAGLLLSIAMFPIMLSASLNVLLRMSTSFRVTSKVKVATGVPWRFTPNVVLALVSVAAIWVGLGSGASAAAVSNSAFAAINAFVLLWPGVLAVRSSPRLRGGLARAGGFRRAALLVAIAVAVPVTVLAIRLGLGGITGFGGL